MPKETVWERRARRRPVEKAAQKSRSSRPPVAADEGKGAPAPDEPVQLPEVLDLPAATSLAAALLKRRGRPTVVHGLEVLSSERPNVIITDINMPRLDGFGFIEQVRTDSRFLGVPILVLTTESSADKKSLARRAGATGWIVKPFDSTKLVDVVRRVTA